MVRKNIEMPSWRKIIKSAICNLSSLRIFAKKKKESRRNNNLEKSCTEKKARHEPSGWAMLTKCSFDEEENKLDYYRGKDCIDELHKKLKEHAIEIINYEKKEMILLTKEENKSYKEQEACRICEEKFCMDEDDENYKNRKKVKDHCHYTGKFREAAHSIWNLRYKVPDNIPLIIHNASYDTHFIINQLAKEFKGEVNCIGENMEKYITFSVPIKKKCDDNKTITHKLMFIDSFRFMNFPLSDIADNLSGRIFNSIVCTKCMERKINAECKFDGLKSDELIYRCRECKLECQRSKNH